MTDRSRSKSPESFASQGFAQICRSGEGVRCDVGADKNNCVEICHWPRIRMRGNVSGSAFFNA